MAGMGSRFANAGFSQTKPFIDVSGKSMIVRVIENLWQPDARFILIVKKVDIEKNVKLFSQIKEKFCVDIVPIDGMTEGTACTVLFARSLLVPEDPIIVANSDQLIDECFTQFLEDARLRNLDGSILTFRDEELNPKWSYAKIDTQGFVTNVKEKKAISSYATVGVYYFQRSDDLINSIIQMVIENDRTNNEFYICPVYNYFIKNGKKIGIFNIDKSQMHGLGTPEDLQKYLQLKMN